MEYAYDVSLRFGQVGRDVEGIQEEDVVTSNETSGGPQQGGVMGMTRSIWPRGGLNLRVNSFSRFRTSYLVFQYPLLISVSHPCLRFPQQDKAMKRSGTLLSPAPHGGGGG